MPTWAEEDFPPSVQNRGCAYGKNSPEKEWNFCCLRTPLKEDADFVRGLIVGNVGIIFAFMEVVVLFPECWVIRWHQQWKLSFKDSEWLHTEAFITNLIEYSELKKDMMGSKSSTYTGVSKHIFLPGDLPTINQLTWHDIDNICKTYHLLFPFFNCLQVMQWVGGW